MVGNLLLLGNWFYSLFFNSRGQLCSWCDLRVLVILTADKVSVAFGANDRIVNRSDIVDVRKTLSLLHNVALC